MRLEVEGLGRKFGAEWIFRNFTYDFHQGKKYALVGNNGSGKSTLLKILGGALLPSKGEIRYSHCQSKLGTEELYKHVAIVAPYASLIEEMTLKELIAFFSKFKPLSLKTNDFIEELRLTQAQNKLVKHFSSGMKQRLQLGLAFYGNSHLILLDEPTSNLDTNNTVWYQKLVANTIQDRLLIISSNQPHEYSCCDEEIQLSDFK